jgi:hypothetical protein
MNTESLAGNLTGAMGAATSAATTTSLITEAAKPLEAAVAKGINNLVTTVVESTASPDTPPTSPQETKAEVALDQANATVESAVVSGTAAEKIAAKSAELVCAELRKNAGAIWQQAANAIIGHLDTPEVMGKFSNSISEAAIKYMPKSLTDAIEQDSGVAAAMIVEIINSISKLKGDTWRYEKDINKYTLGKIANSFRRKKGTSEDTSEDKSETWVPLPPVPVTLSNGTTESAVLDKSTNTYNFISEEAKKIAAERESKNAIDRALASEKTGVTKSLEDQSVNANVSVTDTNTNVVAQSPATVPTNVIGGKNTSSYKGGAIYSFEPELRFIRAMARKSRKFNLKTRSTKKNKRKSRRLRK